MKRKLQFLLVAIFGVLVGIPLGQVLSSAHSQTTDVAIGRALTPNELVKFSSDLQQPVKVIGHASQVSEILEPASMEFFTATIIGEDGGVVIVSMRGKTLRNQLIQADKSPLVFHGKYGGWSFEHGVPFIWVDRFEPAY